MSPEHQLHLVPFPKFRKCLDQKGQRDSVSSSCRPYRPSQDPHTPELPLSTHRETLSLTLSPMSRLLLLLVLSWTMLRPRGTATLPVLLPPMAPRGDNLRFRLRRQEKSPLCNGPSVCLSVCLRPCASLAACPNSAPCAGYLVSSCVGNGAELRSLA